MELLTLPIERLEPAPWNPRKRLKPDSPAYRKLETSLREFGLVEPLIWNETSNRVVGGHARLSILKSLGYAEVPVSVVRLTPAREKALNVVLNNQEAQGRYDPDKLVELLGELADLPEMALSGFGLADLRKLRFEPDLLDEEAGDTGEKRIAIVVPGDRLEEVGPLLDAIVRRYDLECHISR